MQREVSEVRTSLESAVHPAPEAASPKPAQQQQEQQQQQSAPQPESEAQVTDAELAPHLLALVRSISGSCGSDIVPFLVGIKPEDIAGKFEHMSRDGGCHPFAAMRHFKSMWVQGQSPSVPVPSDQTAQEQHHQPRFPFGGRGFKCSGGQTAPAHEQQLTLQQIVASGFPREWAAAALVAFPSGNQAKILEVLSSFPFDASQAGVEALVNMGFDEDKARIALLKSAGNVCSWSCCCQCVIRDAQEMSPTRSTACFGSSRNLCSAAAARIICACTLYFYCLILLVFYVHAIKSKRHRERFTRRAAEGGEDVSARQCLIFYKPCIFFLTATSAAVSPLNVFMFSSAPMPSSTPFNPSS